MDAKQLQSALDILGSDGKNIAVYHRSPLTSAGESIDLSQQTLEGIQDGKRFSMHSGQIVPDID